MHRRLGYDHGRCLLVTEHLVGSLKSETACSAKITDEKDEREEGMGDLKEQVHAPSRAVFLWHVARNGSTLHVRLLPIYC